MKKLKFWAIYILILYLILEVAVRCFWVSRFEVPFFHPSDLSRHYYPELKSIDPAFQASTDEKKFLVLGGSVLATDTMVFPMNGKEHAEVFCNMPHYLGVLMDSVGLDKPFKVISLAVPAHNSLDSWYKYRLLKKYHFDWVMVYHGINDNRTNNCTDAVFDPNYRHMAFYNELYVYFRHPEMNLTALPFTLDWLYNLMTVNKGWRTTIPQEVGPDWEQPGGSVSYQYGDKIKSAPSFRRNYERIIELAKQKEEKLILPTYAYYLADNYTFEAFRNEELDYDAQVFPAELFGRPVNVVKGIKMHNEIIHLLAVEYPEINLLVFEESLPKSGQYFDDICHLNEQGCGVLAKMVLQEILQDIR